MDSKILVGSHLRDGDSIQTVHEIIELGLDDGAFMYGDGHIVFGGPSRDDIYGFLEHKGVVSSDLGEEFKIICEEPVLNPTVFEEG